MCGSAPPEPIKPPDPPAPPPIDLTPDPVEIDSEKNSSRRKKKSRGVSGLRIRMNKPAGGSGVNVPN